MKPTFLTQRINFLGSASLIVGEQKIAGEALMCGTLYVEVGQTAGFASASSHPGFRPSDISGSFKAGDAEVLSAIKTGAAQILWNNHGKETTLAIAMTEVRGNNVKFVARKS